MECVSYVKSPTLIRIAREEQAESKMDQLLSVRLMNGKKRLQNKKMKLAPVCRKDGNKVRH